MYEVKAGYEVLRGLPGEFHAGMWYHDGFFIDPGDPGVRHKGNHGVYLGADQLILKENYCDRDDDQGLGMFVQYGWSPEDRNDCNTTSAPDWSTRV